MSEVGNGNGKTARALAYTQIIVGIIVSIMLVLNAIVLIPLRSDIIEVKSERKDYRSKHDATHQRMYQQMNENTQNIIRVEGRLDNCESYFYKHIK